MKKTAKALLVFALLGVYSAVKFGLFIYLTINGRWLELVLFLFLLLLAFLAVGVYMFGYFYRQAVDKGDKS